MYRAVVLTLVTCDWFQGFLRTFTHRTNLSLSPLPQNTTGLIISQPPGQKTVFVLPLLGIIYRTALNLFVFSLRRITFFLALTCLRHADNNTLTCV